MNRKLRVLHAPTNVGGNAWYLSRAERALGVESDLVVYQSTYFGFAHDRDLRLGDHSWFVQEILRWRFLIAAARKYDVFHFNFGTSLVTHPLLGMYHIDVALLKRLGKSIVVTYQGCDLRSFALSTSQYEISACAECGACRGLRDSRKAASSAVMERYADHVYVLNPDLARVAPSRAEFRPYTKLDPAEWATPQPRPRGESIRVVHAPTGRDVKGTKYVQMACDVLVDEGYPVELKLIEGISRDQAVREYRTADIFIDQLLVGWYGGVAVEGMALCKPVICYLRHSDFDILPGSMAEDIPIVNATPSSLVDALRRLVDDPELCHSLGQRGRAYVQKWHDPLKVAQITKGLYERLLCDQGGCA